jgi:hsp70-interacting protein
MTDPGLSELLKWSVEHSTTSQNEGTASENVEAPRGLSAQALQTLLGGPSDADLMRAAMSTITSSDPEITLPAKVVAFDNFEQLLENIDNANNLGPLDLWDPLIKQLDNDEAELRKMAAWCIGTAVQNNKPAQERLVVLGALPRLTNLTLTDEDAEVRKKSVRAISSAVRNYQAGLDEVLKLLTPEIKGDGKLDAGDMDQMDGLMTSLREVGHNKGGKA